MAVEDKGFGEIKPVCSECGVYLCWSIDIYEYDQYKPFWDEWKCRDCNPEYKGAYDRYKQKIKQDNERTI